MQYRKYLTPSAEVFRKRIEHTLEKYPYLVIEKDGRIMGYTYAGPFVGREAYGRSCELSIYIDKDARKCGYKFGRWYSMIWMEKIIGKHD